MTDDQSDWDPDDEPDGREGRCLPCNGGADLPAVEAERFEDGELATAAPDAGDQRMSDGEQGEHREKGGKGCGKPVDLPQAVDLDRDRGTEGSFDL